MTRAILELLRPANVVTALADVLAGYGVAGLQHRAALPWLLVSTAALYAGGIVLNDVFDRHADRIERPERPIPSGRVRVSTAAALGGALLAAGVAAAARATWHAGLIAGAIAAAVLAYDSWGKRHVVTAPVNMGLCRGLNLLLGIAAAPLVLRQAWPLAFIPFVYIAGVTALSRGEVHGGSRRAATVALISLTAASFALLTVAGRSGGHAVPAVALVLLLGFRVLPPVWHAWKTPAPATVRSAVKRGVLSLVLLDAALGTAYAGPVYGAVILATAFVAGSLARSFSVT